MKTNYIKNLKNNKKGDMSIPIAILIVLIIILVSYTLITLVSVKGTYVENIGYSKIIENSSIREEKMNFYFSSVAEKAVYSSYEEFIVNGGFVEDKIGYTNLEDIYGFEEIHSEKELNKRFSELVEENFLKIFKKEYSDNEEKDVSEFLDKLKNNGKEDFLTVNYKKGVVSFKTKELSFSSFRSSPEEFHDKNFRLYVKYDVSLEEEINLSRKNLNSFHEIYKFKESYLDFLKENNPDESSDVFLDNSEFNTRDFAIADNFEIDFISVDDKIGVSLISKRKFPVYSSSVKREIKKIGFSFVPK